VKEDMAIRGVYKVEYQVVSAGNYQMSITVDGVHIAGSPFSVTVAGKDESSPSCLPF
jgi:hypothetical protein